MLVMPPLIVILGETLHQESLLRRNQRVGLVVQMLGAILCAVLILVSLVGGWLWTGQLEWIVCGCVALLGVFAAGALLLESRRRLKGLPRRYTREY